MTQPSFPLILQGIFPDATEVEVVKGEGDFPEGYIVKFDPQKCVMTPANWDIVSKLGYKIQKMILNTDTNQMEVHI